ncbi:hypothetical protein BKA56DRAFT_606801 [Ilyonectria sp. MPI-CAGE-AT-0026]|nr:hypothetical protein BKA56DRAFT_606801 [Ilyonectria sp. MPI-CAGE-AT-0026]
MEDDVQYRVDSFHVNVLAGDASFHVLLSLDPNDANARPTVQAAVVIDGGESRFRGTTEPNIMTTLGRMAELYDWPNRPNEVEFFVDNPVRFDAVVITHWDHDHYTGILQYIQVDLRQRFLDDRLGLRNGKVRIFRYLPDADGKSQPLTTLYCPNFQQRRGFSVAGRQVGTGNVSGKDYYLTRTDTATDRLLNIYTRRTRRGMNFVANRVAKVVEGPNRILGIDFFTGETLDRAQLGNVGQIIARSANFQGGQNKPGLFCISCGGQYLVPPPPDDPAPAVAIPVADPAAPTLRFIIPEVVDKSYGALSATNHMSIAAVVVWRPTNDNEAARISHYMAGDADYVNENRILQWLGDDVSISSMKLSHHGSASSTPVGLLTRGPNVNPPARLIISAGYHYGHPRFELLMYLAAQYIDPLRPPPLYVTNYPYWFGKRTGADNQLEFLVPQRISPVALTQAINAPEIALLRNFMNGVYDDPLDNPWVAVEPILGGNDPDRRGALLRFAADWCIRRWNRLSRFDETYYPPLAVRNLLLPEQDQRRTIVYHRLEQTADGHDDMIMTYLGNPDNGEQLIQGPAVAAMEVDIPPAQAANQDAADIPAARTTDQQFQDNDPEPNFSLSEENQLIVLAAEGPQFNMLPTPDPAASPPAASPPPAQFLLCSSVIRQLPAGGIVVLSAPLNSFVSNLRTGWIALDSAPTATAWADLSQNDSMRLWFQVSFGITSFRALGADDAGDNLRSLLLATSMAGNGLTFSTDYTDSALGISTPILDPHGPGETPSTLPGLFGNMLILGLQPVPPTSTSGDPGASIKMQMVTDEVYKEAPKLRPILIGLFDSIIVQFDLDPIASQGRRNAMWFSPSFNYTTCQRLELPVVSMDADATALFDRLHLKLTDTRVIIKRKMMLRTGGSGRPSRTIEPTVAMTATTSLVLDNTGTQAPDLHMALVFQPQTTEMVLYSDEGIHTDTLFDWLVLAVGNGAFQKPDLGGVLRSSVVQAFSFRRVSVSLDQNFKIQSFNFSVECDMAIGRPSTGPDSTKDLAALFTFNWKSSADTSEGSGISISGSLWFNDPAPPVGGVTYEMLPDYEDYENLTAKPETLKTLSLVNLLPEGTVDVSRLPTNAIPFDVDCAKFTLSSTTFQVYGSLICDSSTGIAATPAASSSPTAPSPMLNQIFLDATWTFAGQSGSSGTSDISFGFSIDLIPSLAGLEAGYDIAMLSGSLEYASSGGDAATWTIIATALNLNMAGLYNYFDSDTTDSVMSILKHIYIQDLQMTYMYDKSAGNTFDVVGTVILGDFEFDLAYVYTGPGKWTFECDLRLEQETDQSTIGAIVSDIFGSDVTLPAPLANVMVDLTAQAKLNVFRTPNPDDETNPKVELLFCSAEIDLGPSSLSFARFLEAHGTGEYQTSKTALIASLNKFEPVDVPLISQLPQPFDELYVMWVDDPSSDGGLTVNEVASLNSHLTTKVYYKTLAKGEKIAVKNGLHLVVVALEDNQPTVVLDYMFHENPVSRSSRLLHLEDVNNPSYSGPTNAPAMAPMGKTIGPLTISNLGLHYQNSQLSIMLDATLKLGPIRLSILGFTLSADFSRKDESGNPFSFHNLPSLSASITGLGAEFDEPPVVMTSLFEKQNDLYLGGVAISVQPYVFQAAGEYGIIENRYKTVSIFTSLAGPLIELEFAEISGMCGGFGYNSILAFPTAQNVTQFPFFQSAIIGKDPLQSMENMFLQQPPWIAPVDGDYWLAAGLTIKALQLLNMEAVVVVSFDPSFKLGFFADAVAAIPDDPNTPKLAYVELGVVAVADFTAGTMAVDGVLAPTSFILDPMCHLTGGFALYYWFGNNAHAGDWVFTLGGYHASYTPQPYYPRPARLAISWNIDDSLSITGEAYFAITPAVCMAGGRLDALLGLGPLSAWFEAWADFLINYRPLYYMGDVGVDVGVRFTLDLWICTIQINVDIGASLHIEGPSCHGYVHVDFWVFGFDIYFGGTPAPPEPLALLADFYSLVKQSAKQSGSTGNDHVLTCEDGMAPTADRSQAVAQQSQWVVGANTFAFGIACAAAVKIANVKGGILPPTAGNLPDFYARPWGGEYPLKSELAVTVTLDEDKSEVDGFVVEPVMKNVPLALWGQYNSSSDPSQSGNQISSLLDGTNTATTSLCMGISLSAPAPTLSPDKIPKFNALAANKQDVFDPPLGFLPMDNEAGTWLPQAPEDDIVKQYADIEAAWTAPVLGTTAAATATSLFVQAFGWLDDQGKALELDGAPPGVLVSAMDQFYLAPPVISAS